ncbi:MAG: TetR/AcrR family transcriptional regulator [Pseudonocardiaceae bacterium]
MSPPSLSPGQPPCRRRLPRQVRERQMLDAAVAVFSRRGFHLASMDDIAEVAGVSKPMIYAYLGSKDDLFIACIRREGQRLMELISAAVSAGLTRDERLYRGLLAFFEFVTDHRDGWIVLYRQARVHGSFAGEIVAARQRIIVMVAVLLARSSDDDAHARAMPLAHAVVGAAEALSDWALAHPEETPDALATRLTTLLRGCAP